MADAECLVASTLNLVCLVIGLNLCLLTKIKIIVNIEQGYMYNKALFNDDLCAAHKISFMTDPMKKKKKKMVPH